MKKLILPILFLLMVLPAMSQGVATISGTVTDTATGNPIPNHAVVITNDSSYGWYYYHTVYTNDNGHYADTVAVPPASQGVLFVQTLDCQNFLHQHTLTYNPVNVSFIADFEICYSNSPCHAAFTTQQQQPLTVQFLDGSVGGGNIREWMFGDGATSSLVNPVHTYSMPGYYNVTLSIGAPGTTCYDVVTHTIHVWDSTGGGCQAAFTVTSDSNALYSYHFWDQSVGNIVSWNWNFGDGTSSSLQNPAHVYNHAGTYVVCLGIHGSDSTCIDYTCDTLVVGNGGGDCEAAFTYYADSSNAGNTIHFIDQSIGNIAYWNWSFGDGTTSNAQNPVHTYATPGYYLVTLSINSPNQSCWDVTSDTIVVGSNPGCQANFTYVTGPNLGNYTAQFTDLSTGVPSSWQWSFGDGTGAIVQNPVHTFGGPGTYYVCLTITGNNCTSIYCHNVVIHDSISYHQVYGQVFAGNFPLSLGLAMIFSLDTNANFQPFVEVSTIDSNGVYYFTSVPDGNYYIMAIPINPTGYLPTYYGNTISWELATLVTLGTPNNPYNINLVESDQLIPGPGSASGQINMGDVSSSMTDKINMILMNAQGNPIGFTTVSETGEFGFSSLAYGTYYLHPEMPGVTSDQIMITLSAEEPHADIVMTFIGNSILGVRNIASQVNQWSVYPNPVTENLIVSIDMKQGTNAMIEIYNTTGQMVLNNMVSLNTGFNNIRVTASSLPSGIYSMRIYSANGLIFTTKLVKTR